MRNKGPLVSIIIPVYNVQNYIKECIESVLAQTYNNIEVIAVDDGSTDSSVEILQQYSDERLLIYEHSQNKGQAAARNLGIEVSSGEYVLFVDSDDLIRNDTVEILVAENLKYDVSLVRFNAVSFEDQTDHLFTENAYNSSNYLSESILYQGKNMKEFYLAYTASPVLYLIKKPVIVENNIRFYEGIIHEDELFIATLYLYISSAKYIEQNLYKRRYRLDSTVMDKSEKQLKRSFDSYVSIVKEYKRLLKMKKLSNIKKGFIKYRINSIMYSLFDFPVESEYKAEKIDEIKDSEWYYTRLGKTYYRIQKTLLLLKNKYIR